MKKLLYSGMLYCVYNGFADWGSVAQIGKDIYLFLYKEHLAFNQVVRGSNCMYNHITKFPAGPFTFDL